MSLLRIFHFKRSKEDEELIRLVRDGFKSARVVGRGRLAVDPREVRDSPEFKEAMAKAQKIVENTRKQDG